MNKVRELHKKSVYYLSIARKYKFDDEGFKSNIRKACAYESSAAYSIKPLPENEPTRAILFISAASFIKNLKDKGIEVDTVPVIGIGIYNKELLNLSNSLLDGTHEGYVIRLKNQFTYDDYKLSVAKYVRANHVQTDQHWMHQPIVKNTLKIDR
jgi:hypothetical protein